MIAAPIASSLISALEVSKLTEASEACLLDAGWACPEMQAGILLQTVYRLNVHDWSSGYFGAEIETLQELKYELLVTCNSAVQSFERLGSEDDGRTHAFCNPLTAASGELTRILENDAGFDLDGLDA